MKTVIVLLVVLALGAGLYTLAAGGVGGLVGAARKKADGNDDPFDVPPGRRGAPGSD